MTHALIRRAVVLGAAVGAGLAVWGVARLAGVDLVLTEDAPSERVDALDVVVTVMIAGIAAGAVHTALVRAHAGRYWPVIGSTVLSISIIGPVWFANGVDAVALIGMHFAVGFALIMGFGRFVGGDGEAYEDEEEPVQRRIDSPYQRMR